MSSGHAEGSSAIFKGRDPRDTDAFKLYVFGLPTVAEFTEFELEVFFGFFGRIVDVASFKFQKANVGSGFVKFMSPTACINAIKLLDGKVALKGSGKILKICWSKWKESADDLDGFDYSGEFIYDPSDFPCIEPQKIPPRRVRWPCFLISLPVGLGQQHAEMFSTPQGPSSSSSQASSGHILMNFHQPPPPPRPVPVHNEQCFATPLGHQSPSSPGNPVPPGQVIMNFYQPPPPPRPVPVINEQFEVGAVVTGMTSFSPLYVEEGRNEIDLAGCNFPVLPDNCSLMQNEFGSFPESTHFDYGPMQNEFGFCPEPSLFDMVQTAEVRMPHSTLQPLGLPPVSGSSQFIANNQFTQANTTTLSSQSLYPPHAALGGSPPLWQQGPEVEQDGRVFGGGYFLQADQGKGALRESKSDQKVCELPSTIAPVTPLVNIVNLQSRYSWISFIQSGLISVHLSVVLRQFKGRIFCCLNSAVILSDLLVLMLSNSAFRSSN